MIQDILRELCNPWEKEPPLSLPDLIRLGTFDLDLAAWLVSQVSRGASFIVGAGPGGVGKSTLMRALLGFAPAGRPWVVALPGKITGIKGPAHCVISHEVSDHGLPAYLWGQDLRDFFTLSAHGHQLAGNMHADTLDEVRDQTVVRNNVPLPHFHAVRLFIFISAEDTPASTERVKNKSARRTIRSIYYSSGTTAQQAIYTGAQGLADSAPRDKMHLGHCREFLEQALKGRPQTLLETRQLFLEWDNNKEEQ